jgi:predicted DNA-binding transcriptional regulator AlpA
MTAQLIAERLLTRAEVADLLQMPIKTLARWASRGEGPPYLKVGRHTRYDIGELRRWLDDQRSQRRTS